MAASSEAIPAVGLAAQQRKHRTLWGDVWRQFRKHKLAMIGTTILTLLIFAVFIGPLIYPVSPETIDIASSDRKSTRLNSSHSQISYAVFCLKKKKNNY